MRDATLAFDVYGTLIDTGAVAVALQAHVGALAPEFARTWRDKQLEYSFRRGLMQHYQAFSVCTRQALDYACLWHGVALGAAQQDALLDVWRTLPAFDDALDALRELRAAGYRLFAFSNGTAAAVEAVLDAAGIRDRFLGVVSVDDLRSFKPNPAVYAHFLRASGAAGHSAWLVSSNPFDVIGAVSAGLRAAWVRRSDEVVFDPWEIEPTISVRSLRELGAGIEHWVRAQAG